LGTSVDRILADVLGVLQESLTMSIGERILFLLDESRMLEISEFVFDARR